MQLDSNLKEKIQEHSFLVTGGAGFVGSNLVEFLLNNGAKKVRVIDNLSNGYKKNIEEFLKDDRFEFIEGDISIEADCKKALEGIDFLSHPEPRERTAHGHGFCADGFLHWNLPRSVLPAEPGLQPSC